MPLIWPIETVSKDPPAVVWHQPASNIVLDFHGDPLKARLVVFSDGNHHMALEPALRAFYKAYPEVEDIFYATTPPGPIIAFLKMGALQLGNLKLSLQPDLFISPPRVMAQLQKEGFVRSHQLLARNRGSVLLVGKGNPKQITGIADLMRDDVRLFISNPDTETVSYEGYRETLAQMAADQGLAMAEFSRMR